MVGTIDLIVIILYFVFILIVGVVSYRKVKNETDYSLAGRSLGYPTLVGAITATAIGAGATLGVGGLSYNFGIVVVWSIVAYALGLIGFSFIARVIRRLKYWTIPEVLLARYGNTARIISAAFLLLGLIALFGVQVAALGTVFTAVGGSLWGVTYGHAVLIAGAVMIAYTFAGGMFALAYTEIVQAILLLVILGVMLPIFLFKGMDFGWMAAKMPSRMLDLFGGAPLFTVIGWFLTLIPICFIDVSLWQRASSARDEHVARKSIVISTILYFGYSLSIIFVGMIGFYLYPSLKALYGTNDVVVPVLIMNNLPPVMIGLVDRGHPGRRDVDRRERPDGSGHDRLPGRGPALQAEHAGAHRPVDGANRGGGHRYPGDYLRAVDAGDFRHDAPVVCHIHSRRVCPHDGGPLLGKGHQRRGDRQHDRGGRHGGGPVRPEVYGGPARVG